MLTAVLIDLDNTMVLFDEPAFFDRYFERITPWFGDLVTAETFRARLLAATSALRRNDGAACNREVFLDHFCSGLSAPRSRIWRRFESFYDTQYGLIPVKAAPPPGLLQVLERLEAAGLKRIVATNPVFPSIAVAHRLSWVGIDSARFDGVTHIGNMSAVKPSTAYFREICDRIGEPPESCLMVGNDAVNDLAAAGAGLKTYLTTDAAEAGAASISLTSDSASGAVPAPVPDFKGPFRSVVDAVGVLEGR